MAHEKKTRELPKVGKIQHRYKGTLYTLTVVQVGEGVGMNYWVRCIARQLLRLWPLSARINPPTDGLSGTWRSNPSRNSVQAASICAADTADWLADVVRQVTADKPESQRVDDVARLPAGDRADLFSATAGKRVLRQQIIEKDFWVGCSQAVLAPPPRQKPDGRRWATHYGLGGNPAGRCRRHTLTCRSGTSRCG